MIKLNKIMIYGMTKAPEAMKKILAKKKPGADDIVMKAGLIAVAFAVIAAWRIGILDLVADWISNMTTQSASFWT